MKTKKCFKCSKRKPLSDFYKHPRMADGHLGKCKKCAKADVKQNYALRRPQYIAYEKSRQNLPHRVSARKAYAKTENGKQSKARAILKQRQLYPEKYKARIMVSNAIRDGKLISLPCVKCGENKAHAHHEDYSKPLDVMWLCKKHHLERHRELKNGDNPAEVDA